MDELRIAARRAVLAYDECGATISDELIDAMRDVREALDAMLAAPNPPLKSDSADREFELRLLEAAHCPTCDNTGTTPEGDECEWCFHRKRAVAGLNPPPKPGGDLPGPELGPGDPLPCTVACDGGPSFGKGVSLRALLSYLARRVTYNNEPQPKIPDRACVHEGYKCRRFRCLAENRCIDADPRVCQDCGKTVTHKPNGVTVLDSQLPSAGGDSGLPGDDRGFPTLDDEEAASRVPSEDSFGR